MTARQITIAGLLVVVLVLSIIETRALITRGQADTISEIVRDQFARLGTLALPAFGGLCFALGMLFAHFFWLQPAPTNAGKAIESMQSLDSEHG